MRTTEPQTSIRRPPGWAVLSGVAVLILLKPEILFTALEIIRPIFLGVAIAFFMNHIVQGIDKIILKLSGKNSNIKLSVALGYLFFLSAVAGVILIIVPNIWKNASELYSNIDLYYEKIGHYYAILESNDNLGVLQLLSNVLSSAAQGIPAILQKTFLKTSNAFSWIVDGFFGMVISIYIILCKAPLKRGVTALVRNISGEQKFVKITAGYKLVYNSYSKFIIGQMIEAVILGTLCFIGMSIFGFPFAPLISFIIGITAFVPIVGAVVGAVPSALLLFLHDPMSAIWFIVFLIVLQQLENHLIYPKVVGKSIGLPPLLVIISIVLGMGLGSLVGLGRVIGIIITIPGMAAIWEWFRIQANESGELGVEG